MSPYFFFALCPYIMLHSGEGVISAKASPPFPSLLKTTFAKQDFVGNSITTMG